MGGWGSTRWGDIPPKPRTDSVWDLRVTDVLRVAPVRRGRLSKGALPCTRTGRLDVITDATQRDIGVRLEFRRLVLGEWEPHVAEFALVPTEPCLGGERWWFLCPTCGSRRSSLYFLPENDPAWACRRCQGLVYASQSQTYRQRVRRRALKVLAKLGARVMEPAAWLRPELAPEMWVSGKPNGMHWATFGRLYSKLRRLSIESCYSLPPTARRRRLGL